MKQYLFDVGCISIGCEQSTHFRIELEYLKIFFVFINTQHNFLPMFTLPTVMRNILFTLLSAISRPTVSYTSLMFYLLDSNFNAFVVSPGQS